MVILTNELVNKMWSFVLAAVKNVLRFVEAINKTIWV